MIEARWQKNGIQRRGSLNTKQMFYDDDEVKRYKIIKEFRRCYLHEYVRTSICFTIIVQVKIKDMKPVWRKLVKTIFYIVLINNYLNC